MPFIVQKKRRLFGFAGRATHRLELIQEKMLINFKTFPNPEKRVKKYLINESAMVLMGVN